MKSILDVLTDCRIFFKKTIDKELEKILNASGEDEEVFLSNIKKLSDFYEKKFTKMILEANYRDEMYELDEDEALDYAKDLVEDLFNELNRDLAIKNNQ